MLPSSIELIYFLEIATELNYSRAAKNLSVSQPSLSLAIQRLEKLVGSILFIRHKRGVTLTPVGHVLLEDVKKLLDQWDKTIANIKTISQDIKGKVTIGCHSTLVHFLTKMVADLLEQYPGLKFIFSVA